MTKYYFTLLLLIVGGYSKAQSEYQEYEDAYTQIECMLNETCSLSFKEAVFIVEDTYLDHQLDKEQFDKHITLLSQLALQSIQSRELLYNYSDKEDIEKYAAIFSLMTDTTLIQVDENKIMQFMPYTYDFNDIWGHQYWENMFVSKLLSTQKGNCHSLPFLYKIIADEIGAETHIAVAPNHFYIKHQNQANGWYNTELTSGIFPIDAWLMASGYIHLNAIVNKLYMEALNEQQMIALCLIDLAKGFEKKYGADTNNEFILKCCNKALKVYPHYINALLLKAETKTKMFNVLMEKYSAEYPIDILGLPEAKKLFQEMNQLYTKIHQLGYRKMPEEMYLNWLVSLKAERKKYENKAISNNTKQLK